MSEMVAEGNLYYLAPFRWQQFSNGKPAGES